MMALVSAAMQKFRMLHNACAKVLYLDGSISQVCWICEGKKNLDLLEIGGT